MIPMFLVWLLGPKGCGDVEAYKFQYECECWDPATSFFTIGTPSPCADSDEEAVEKAERECSDEVGQACACECEQVSQCGSGQGSATI